MPKILALTLLACCLIGCAPSRKVTPPLRLPAPPAEALQPCRIPVMAGGNAEAVEAALIARGAEIARCEAVRRALLLAWPVVK